MYIVDEILERLGNDMEEVYQEMFVKHKIRL